MEFKIENTKVYGIEKAIVASGNSYRTSLRDESELDEKDNIRAIKLGQVAPGTGHDTFLNACLVTMDIVAPLYWWKQAQRYHWLEFVSSQSTMHCVLKFDIKNQCTNNVDLRIIDILEMLVADYNKAKEENNIERANELWYKIIASLPCGFCLGATMTTNYRQLKTICIQRNGHRLKEWKTFIDWCKTLPKFLELTGIK